MLDSRDRLDRDRLDTPPAAPPVAPQAPQAPPSPFARLGDRIPGVMAFGIGLAWIVMLQVMFSLAPPADPAAPPSLLGIVIGDLLLISLLTGAVGLGMRRRWGLLAALGGGAVLLFGAVACQLIGHSGAALVAQYAAGGALTAFSWGGLRAS